MEDEYEQGADHFREKRSIEDEESQEEDTEYQARPHADDIAKHNTNSKMSNLVRSNTAGQKMFKNRDTTLGRPISFRTYRPLVLEHIYILHFGIRFAIYCY